MKTLIHEIGVLDKIGVKHPVYFKKGLNIVTGKSSTGKSALIEIFDYCFGSSEYTVPKGIITESAVVYYVFLQVGDQNMIIARSTDLEKKAFFRRESFYNSGLINLDYFENSYFFNIKDYRKHLRDFFLDIDDVDESLAARENRRHKAKAATPSIRSLTSFMLQHQNLVANKHALFYRFDEKEKRDQVLEHTKIFLGLVDQEFFILSQEHERLSAEINKLKRQQDANRRATLNQQKLVEPILDHLYSMMGFEEEPISVKKILRNPQDAKDLLDEIIVPEKIVHNSGEVTKRYSQLNRDLTLKTSQLRKLQRQENSIKHHIEEEERFFKNSQKFDSPEKVVLATTVCPFCQTEHEQLTESAEKLQSAINKVSSNLAQTKPMTAKFQSELISVKRNIEICSDEVKGLSDQIKAIEKSEKELRQQKSLYESILKAKARLLVLLETLGLADDIELDKRLKSLDKEFKKTAKKLNQYDIQKGLEEAATKVNEYMEEIGQHFEFEKSYKPIKLNFSFETFDLYHETDNGEQIYLRSMGSGANWLYCHITLFLALHRYFVELGDDCSIPSVLFLDQPTQVYFPNFKRDNADNFKMATSVEQEQRTKGEPAVDEDIKAVENLFSQLSTYCDAIEKAHGFSPQIIVTDHADDLTLSNEVSFESLVNGNRWRTRGFINPVPSELVDEI